MRFWRGRRGVVAKVLLAGGAEDNLTDTDCMKAIGRPHLLGSPFIFAERGET